jgi:hypothetical protein
MRPTPFALCALLASWVPCVAAAQATTPTAQAAPAAGRGDLTVIGLRAPDGDVELASRLSVALREVARAASHQVAENAPTLDQEFAMAGCTTADASCLSLISSDLHAQRFVYGAVQRSGRGADATLSVDLNVWDEGARRELPPETVTLTRAQATAGAVGLREVAQQLFSGVMRREQAAQQAEADRLAQAEAARRPPVLTVTQPAVAPRRSHVRRWVGVGLLGVGVVLGGLAAWQWAQSDGYGTDSLNGQGQYGAGWAAYENTINRPVNGVRPLSVDDVCARAATDAAANTNAAQTNQLCEASSASRTLAWAFGLGGIALAGAGAAFVVLDSMGGHGDAAPQPAQARLHVSPVLSPTVSGVNVDVTF